MGKQSTKEIEQVISDAATNASKHIDMCSEFRKQDVNWRFQAVLSKMELLATSLNNLESAQKKLMYVAVPS